MQNQPEIPEQSTQLSSADESFQEKNYRYGFRISDLGFLIPLGAHSTLIEDAMIFSVPNTIVWLRGLINLRGTMVPVFDLGRMLETELKPTKNSIIVMQLGKNSFAFVIDSGQTMDESSLSPAESSIPQQLVEFTDKVYQLQETPWLEFDFIKCLNHFEQEISV